MNNEHPFDGHIGQFSSSLFGRDKLKFDEIHEIVIFMQPASHKKIFLLQNLSNFLPPSIYCCIQQVLKRGK
jgi:hypothetical protein